MRQDDAEIINDIEIRGLEAGNALDKSTVDILKRNVSVFEILSNQSLSMSIADFEMMHDATMVSPNLNKSESMNNNNNVDQDVVQNVFIKNYHTTIHRKITQ